MVVTEGTWMSVIVLEDLLVTEDPLGTPLLKLEMRWRSRVGTPSRVIGVPVAVFLGQKRLVLTKGASRWRIDWVLSPQSWEGQSRSSDFLRQPRRVLLL